MVARLIFTGLLSLVTLFLSSWETGRINAQDILVVIYDPLSGQVVQGQIPIDIGVVAPGYTKVELQFTYTNLTNYGWFLIAESDQIPFDGILTQWDTTAIKDGEYDLRLVALNGNLEPIIYTVTNLRVRNYSTVETETPTPILPTGTFGVGQATVEPESSKTILAPTLTPFPTNPVIFTSAQFVESISLGGSIVMVVFLVFGIYVGVRRYILNRE